MNPRIKNLIAHDDYTLSITFDNNEIKVFDMKPYLNIGIFKKLKSLNAFKSAHIQSGTIQWNGGQDLCPDTFYEESVPLSVV